MKALFDEKITHFSKVRRILTYRKIMLKNKIEYIVMLIAEFAKRNKMTSQEAFRYLVKYKGFELCDQHYGIMHTLSLDENLDGLIMFCKKNGGTL